MANALVGILFVALVATAGDFVWYEFGVRHRMAVGVLHGAVLLTAVGGVLGVLSGRVLRGLPIGAIAGVAGALAYYALAPLMRSGAMLVAWGVLWIVIALFDGVFLKRPPRSMSQSLMRGGAAAVLSGLAFYLVVDTLWGRAPADGRNYLLQFAAWAIAWAPGVLALTQKA